MTKQPFHFYASSVGEWRVSDDIEALIKGMKRSGLDFAIWKVPGAKDSQYEIRNYAPVVEGWTYLGTYQRPGPKGGTWKMLCQE